jgi:hypothetical protein
VTTIHDDLATGVGMSTLARTSNAQSCHQAVKSRTRVERRYVVRQYPVRLSSGIRLRNMSSGNHKAGAGLDVCDYWLPDKNSMIVDGDSAVANHGWAPLGLKISVSAEITNSFS